MDLLEDEAFLNESQSDAVAVALASSPFHLIQGPPGTGKTHALARLVEELVKRGERVLITGFTHRAIHNALRKIHERLGNQCPIVKISKPISYDPLPVPVHPDLAGSGLDLHPGPYVIGATPFALYSNRLDSAHFDSAVFDETSQLTVPATLMAMMKSDQWFFFGDHKQLPPVSLTHPDDPARASVFDRKTKPTLTPVLLDLDQEWCVKNQLFLPLENEPSETASTSQTRLVTGVAGSGKSLILLYRTALLSRLTPPQKILLLTHNKPILNELKRRLKHLTPHDHHIQCLTFFQWSHQHLGSWPERTIGEHEIRRILAQLQPHPFKVSFLADEIGRIKDHSFTKKSSSNPTMPFSSMRLNSSPKDGSMSSGKRSNQKDNCSSRPTPPRGF
jgi:hypothetical protein